MREPGERGRRLKQGTFSIVETVLPSQEVVRAGEQLCVLLGFRTTEDNCVDTAEADSERSQEARSWRDWTGIGTLYQAGSSPTIQSSLNKLYEEPDKRLSTVFIYLIYLKLSQLHSF